MMGARERFAKDAMRTMGGDEARSRDAAERSLGEELTTGADARSWGRRGALDGFG